MATWVISTDVTHASIKFLNKSGVEPSYHIWLSPLPNNYEETVKITLHLRFEI